MGVAVGFKEECVVRGYGEPDYHEKLMLMHKAFLEISKHGLDPPSVGASIEKLIMGTDYSHMYQEEMIDIVINNIRPLVVGLFLPIDVTMTLVILSGNDNLPSELRKGSATF